MGARTSSKTVWLVAHVEFLGCTTHPHRDPLLSHAASSRRAALTWIRRRRTSAWSWWEVFTFEIDCPSFEHDDASATPVLHLDSKGKLVKAPNVRAARTAFLANRKRELDRGDLSRDEDRCAFCKRASKRRRA